MAPSGEPEWLRKAREKGLVVNPDGSVAPPSGPGPEPLPPSVLLPVRDAGFPDPVPEVEFARESLGRLWRFDFAWPGYRVAFERHGGKFAESRCPNCGARRTVFVSRHHSREGLEDDLEKVNAGQHLGWLVVQATPRMIRNGVAAAQLLAALEARRAARG